MSMVEMGMEGGGWVDVALHEANYTLSKGQMIVGVPVALYDSEGQWRNGGTVYTSLDYDGLMSETLRWAHDSVRTAHES
jgi:hypothetical protein